MKKFNRGFTSIELLIAVAIIAILLVIAVSGLNWSKKYSIDTFTTEVKDYIGYVRNTAALSSKFMCIEKDADVDGDFLVGNYLKEASSPKGSRLLRIRKNITITSSNGSSSALLCFYPNGFLIDGQSVKPTNNELSSIMLPTTTEYFKSFAYSSINQLKITLTDPTTGDFRDICLANGGEFTVCQ